MMHTRSSPLPVILLLLSAHVYSQIGTITQDISTLPAFSRQKPCAISCFMTGSICPEDLLGVKLGCAPQGLCSARGWQAKNDCYCRPDLQTPAHEWLTSCIQKYCSVGDAAIDASTAGALYGQYCEEKGYPAGALPATVQATITASDGTVHTSAKIYNAGPTAGSGSTTTASSSSNLGAPSLWTIIGIVVGSIAGLAFLAVAFKVFWKLCGPCFKRKPVQEQHQLPLIDHKSPVYPMHSYPELYYPPPRMEDELRPDDSFSVAGGLARPAPTLVSDGGPPRRW
jgi:hypothetical protein